MEQASAEVELWAAGRRNPAEFNLEIDRFLPVDLTEVTKVEGVCRTAHADAIVNFAARTDVDGLERERPGRGPLGNASPGMIVNASAPEAMARGAKAAGSQFATISTDFVFDGTSGPYSESAPPAAGPESVSWYGWTKAEMEQRVIRANPSAFILRISYPYRSKFARKLDFARGMMERQASGNLMPLFSDQQLTPTWVPDVSNGLRVALERQLSGIFHAASPSTTTPLEFGTRLLQAWTGRPPSISMGLMAEVLKRPGATPRPLRGGLTTSRLASAGVPMTSWSDGIELLVREERST